MRNYRAPAHIAEMKGCKRILKKRLSRGLDTHGSRLSEPFEIPDIYSVHLSTNLFPPLQFSLSAASQSKFHCSRIGSSVGLPTAASIVSTKYHMETSCKISLIMISIRRAPLLGLYSRQKWFTVLLRTPDQPWSFNIHR